MRVRDHIALSTAGAALLGPWVGRGVLGLWAGSVLIDADHYLWFCLRRRGLNPLAALHFFDQVHPPQHSATRMLHSPAALIAAFLLGVRRRGLLPVALGMSLHVALDTHHEVRMSRARRAALERDEFACQACGTRAPTVGTHLEQQPWLFPSYETQNLTSLCDPCHEAAHARGRVAWR
jgi:5-methylcytosine-specific restriction endonuclease McrA